MAWKKRLMALIMILALMPGLPARMEAELFIEEEEEEIEIVGQIRTDIPTLPPVSMYTGKVLYRGEVGTACTLRKDRSSNQNATRLMNVEVGTPVEILDVDVDWVYVRCRGRLGWLKRAWISGRPNPVDPVNTPPYGVYPYHYVATVARDTYVYEQLPDDRGLMAKVPLTPGARVAIMDIHEGWGRFFYNHTYGYIDMADMKDLLMVSPVGTVISGETPIATFTTYYDTSDTEINWGHTKNLELATKLITKEYPAGKGLDFNKDVGPFTPGNGYYKAIAYANGTTQLGYGGGVCQVASVLFNLLLQMPDIEIQHRRSHGRNGAVYVPVGTDASVGTETLNLRFRNTYDYDLRLESHMQDGALTLIMWKCD